MLPYPGVLWLEEAEVAEESELAEGDVEEQNPAPAGSLRKQAAEQDADCAADPGDGRPDAEGGVPVTRGAERAGQRRQRCRRQHGGPHALYEASADEQRFAVRQPAGQ